MRHCVVMCYGKEIIVETKLDLYKICVVGRNTKFKIGQMFPDCSIFCLLLTRLCKYLYVSISTYRNLFRWIEISSPLDLSEQMFEMADLRGTLFKLVE